VLHLLRAPPNKTDHAPLQLRNELSPSPTVGTWSRFRIRKHWLHGPVVHCGLGRSFRINILLPSSGWKNVGWNSPLRYNAVRIELHAWEDRCLLYLQGRRGSQARKHNTAWFCCFLSRYSFTLMTDSTSYSETSGGSCNDAAMLFSSIAMRPPPPLPPKRRKTQLFVIN
jgi:hypothetical protein